MALSKEFYGLVRDTYGPFLPSSKGKKETFLEKARDKVAHYKPKMEKICGVDLGKVNVKDFKYWVGDFMGDRLQERYREYAEKEGHEPSKFTKMAISSPFFLAQTIAEPLIWSFMSLWGAEMKHYNSSIYVPFHFQNRFMDMDFKRREKSLDQTIVHELSHKLWYSLGGDETTNSERNWRLWNEGFASYCEDIHFADLYPKNLEIEQRKGSGTHARGKKKVEELVERYGKEILLEIPKKWVSFK